MACCGTLTLSWSPGEKRCLTSLGPCWWRSARPIRCRGVSHHVTASPIAIYFTIGQMKRLILTICSLMCFPHSFSSSSLSPFPLSLQTPGISWDQIFKNHLLWWVTFQDTINGEDRVDRQFESSAPFVIYNCQLMLPSTALVSALCLPVANYSSAHLADLLAGREEGEWDEHDPSETKNIPAICRTAFMPPQPGEKVWKRNKEEKSERGDKEERK